MKQQNFEKRPGKVQKSVAGFETVDVRPLHASTRNHLCMPELKDTGAKRRLQRSSDEFRRKTRSQALSEKQAKDAVSSSLSFSEVSIETLHGICAPSASRQANKSLQKQQATSKSLSRTAGHLSRFGIAPYCLPSTSTDYLCLTSQARSPNEPQDKGDNRKAVTEKPPHTSNTADNLPVDDAWLEVFVEFDNGIDLVVDLDSNSFSEWFMERNSSSLVHVDVADEVQRQCPTDSDHLSDRPEGACSGSNDIEAPSPSTTPQNDKVTTLCNGADCDACSQTAQMGMLADSFPSYKLEVTESQESFNSEVKDQGFKFDFFEKMPTFFAASMRRPSADESEVACTTNWMLLCIGA